MNSNFTRWLTKSLRKSEHTRAELSQPVFPASTISRNLFDHGCVVWNRDVSGKIAADDLFEYLLQEAILDSIALKDAEMYSRH